MSQLSMEPTAEETLDPRRWRALAVLALVQFMIAIDNTVVNVALPRMSHSLSLSTVGLAWVVNGYLLAAGGLLLLGGRLADLIGRRKMFLIGTAVFALASLTAGLAQNGAMLITSRFIQGAGEAIASPAALSMVPLLFAVEKERAKAFGIWGGIAGLGATIGVLLSGVLTDLANWRWIFLINVPVALVPLVLVPKLTDDSRSPNADRRIDVPGAVLVTGGTLAVVYGLLQAGQHGWSDAGTWWPLIVGVLALIGFVAWEARAAAPLLPLRFFANRTRVTANVCTILVAGSMMSLFFLVVLYMQNVLGYSPLQAGLAYLPFMVGFTVGLVLSTNLFPRLGARPTIAAGFLASALGMYLMSRISVHGSYLGDLLLPLMVLAFGLGLVNPALQNAALHRVSESDAGLGSGVQTTVMQIGSAMGLAVLIALSVRRTSVLVGSGHPADVAAVSGFQLAFRLAAVVLVVGALIALAFMERMAKAPDAAAAPAAPQPADASRS